MRHLVFSMSSKDKPPAGDGTIEGWFFFYKWDVGGEAYVPLTGVEVPTEGETTLWFLLDGKVLGCAPVSRFQEDAMNDRLEVCYDTQKILDLSKRGTVGTVHLTGLVDACSSSQRFFDELLRYMEASVPPREVV